MGTAVSRLRGLVVLGLLTAACGSTVAPGTTPEADAGNAVDTGNAIDAGNAVDAGNAIDAGNRIDTGNPIDTGNAVDAGNAIDAGNPIDTGLSVCATIRCSAGNACCDVAGAPSYGDCYATTCVDCCTAGGARDAGPAVDLPVGGCFRNADCPTRTQFCAGSGCGTVGTCQTRPQICNSLFSPNCGCDGVTYSNACMAEAAGVRVASRGPCTDIADAGVSPCALIDCTAGQVCCDSPRSPSYGRCYDTRCLACCM